MYAVELSGKAKSDLSEIFQHLKSSIAISNADAALQQIARIKVAVLSLQQMPERFSLLPPDIAGKRAVRKMLVDNYIVFFQVKECRVSVLRILYCRRNWAALF